MANTDQLAVLAQGLEAWNQWRRENSAILIDLSWADVRAFDIGLADALRRADSERHFVVWMDTWPRRNWDSGARHPPPRTRCAARRPGGG